MNLLVKVLKKLIQSDILLKSASIASGRPLADVQGALNRAIKPETPLESIAKLIGNKKDLAIVQVGANDGKTGDPIFPLVHSHASRALLIEPQPWLISELRANYNDFKGHLCIENCAISSTPGRLDLYVLREQYWPEYILKVGRHPSAIFSPDISQLLSRIAPRLQMTDSEARNAIDKVSVPSFRLEDVMHKHDIGNADIVQIDCEGWDYDVIKSLGSIRPPVINFESFNLKDDIWLEFRAWASANSYGYIRGSQDTLALRGFPRQIED